METVVQGAPWGGKRQGTFYDRTSEESSKVLVLPYWRICGSEWVLGGTSMGMIAQ